MTDEELDHLKSQLPGLPVGWECAVADLIDEVRRLRIASLGMFDPVKVGQVVAQLQMERDEAREQRDHWRKLAAEEREEKARMAEVALTYGAHGADCIHHQQNDCNCGLWRELGMV